MNITPVRIYINGNGSISFYGTNNSLITNLQNLNGAKSSDGQITFTGDDKTISFYVYQLTSIESATFSLTYSALDSRFFNPSTYSSKLNDVYESICEYVLVNKNGGASFVGGVVAVYPNYASFPATGQEAVIYIDEGLNHAYFWDGTSYQLLVSTGVEQYASFALFPITGSANVIYIDMSVPEPYVWNGSAYESMGGGTAVWGNITGTLSAQTDLQAALDAKFDDPTGTSSEYLDGTGTPTTFPTIPAQYNPTAGTGINITGAFPNQTITNSAPDQTVALTSGTGISTSGTYPNFTITNSAPDQTVALTAGTGIGVTGTYPNFTISNSDPTSGVTLSSAGGTQSLVNDGTGPSLATKGLTAGTGISLSGTTTAVTVTNSAPDQTVALTAGTGIGVTGTYPNFTITNSSPSSGGTVTSVGTTGLISGGPITGSGTITTSMATNRLVGRYSASTGIMEEITVGSGLTLTGAGILNNTATPTPTGYYGAWQDNVTQTAAASNTGYPIIFRTVDLENQVRVVTNGTNLTRITFDNTGIYNLQFSAQFQNANNADEDVTIWLRLNGVDVPGSAGFVSIPSKHGSTNGHNIVSWNYLLSVVAGQYYELVWSTSNSVHVAMEFYAAGSPPPSAASVILTVTQQAGIMAGTGITAINSLTGAVQTLATGTSGTDFAISSSTSTHTFNLPTASATNRGALSSTDWSAFNAKEDSANKQNSLAIDGTGVKFPTVDAVNGLSFIDKFKRGIQYFTDFEGTASSTPYFANFNVGGSVTRNTTTILNASINQIGFAQYQTGTTATGYFTHISEGFVGAQFFFGGGAWVFETFLCVETLSTSLERFRFIAGFGSSATNGAEGNGTFFTYDEGATQNGTAATPNWQCQTCVNSVRTLTTTSVAVTAGAWTKLRIEVNAAATSVTFYINGTLVATHTTNIPKWLAANNPRGFNVKQSIVKTIGTTTRSVFCDYLGYENVLTTPR